MQLHKTARARAELQPGVRTLGQRERTLLLMADGRRSVQDFRPLFSGDGEQIALRLLREGFLEAHPAKKLERTIGLAARAQATPPAIAPEQTPAPQVARVSADQFEGRRSLATTRMFLFDLCERTFARRSPEMAGRFREALRNARDRDTMLAVSREMIEAIEQLAGHERADSISERLAMLLPVDPALNPAADASA